MITSQNILLRPLLDSEAVLVCDWRNHPSTSKYFYRQHVTPEQYTAEITAARATGSSEIFAIVRHSDNTPIGMISYTLTDDHGTPAARISIIIGHTADRGKGYGREAMDSLDSWLCSTFGVRRIILEVLPSNLSAIAFYEKIGFAPSAIVMTRDTCHDS